MLKIKLARKVGLTICFNINYFKSYFTKINFKKRIVLILQRRYDTA